MQRAFSSRMITKLTKYVVGTGSYDENNVWVNGTSETKTIYGVWKTGNKFSHLEEGEARITEDGGERHSNFRTLYVKEKYQLEMADKIKWKGDYYTVLQRSDESTFGYFANLLEKAKDWTP